jgi:hypothetical protein
VETSELNGIFLCGRLKRVEQVMHGPNHVRKPNQPVAGMHRIVVGLGPDHRFEETASFNEQELGTYEESVVSKVVGDGTGLADRQVLVRVKLRGNKQGYANMEALNV